MAGNFDRKLRLPPIHLRVLLHAANMRQTALLPFRKKACWGFFFSALKNPTASAGFEPANLGTKGQHGNSRPPKPQIPELLQVFPLSESPGPSLPPVSLTLYPCMIQKTHHTQYTDASWSLAHSCMHLAWASCHNSVTSPIYEAAQPKHT